QGGECGRSGDCRCPPALGRPARPRACGSAPGGGRTDSWKAVVASSSSAGFLGEQIREPAPSTRSGSRRLGGGPGARRGTGGSSGFRKRTAGAPVGGGVPRRRCGGCVLGCDGPRSDVGVGG